MKFYLFFFLNTILQCKLCLIQMHSIVDMSLPLCVDQVFSLAGVKVEFIGKVTPKIHNLGLTQMRHVKVRSWMS